MERADNVGCIPFPYRYRIAWSSLCASVESGPHISQSARFTSASASIAAVSHTSSAAVSLAGLVRICSARFSSSSTASTNLRIVLSFLTSLRNFSSVLRAYSGPLIFGVSSFGVSVLAGLTVVGFTVFGASCFGVSVLAGLTGVGFTVFVVSAFGVSALAGLTGVGFTVFGVSSFGVSAFAVSALAASISARFSIAALTSAARTMPFFPEPVISLMSIPFCSASTLACGDAFFGADGRLLSGGGGVSPSGAPGFFSMN